ncbi:hypothetical protein Q5P01_012629 [Channa striata]|uniref:Uncharacterized protein n=1 Tax=Channa striata TaxID=64152 RepID=A0AA88MSQ9_CHASR|nr:hypothetical protein Q5P01_012629 [Channa striata]
MLVTGVEKLVEMEFACPCNPQSNALFASAYFLSPVVTAFLLKMCFGKFKCNNSRDWETIVLNGLVPAIVWIVLLFLDGQYYACAKTDWSGRFVIIDKAAPQKWCEPTNNTSSQELMIKTQMWYYESQVCGILLLVYSVIVFGGLHKLYKLCKSRELGEEDDMRPMYHCVPMPTRCPGPYQHNHLL